MVSKHHYFTENHFAAAHRMYLHDLIVMRSSSQILQAVQTSSTLEIMEHWEVAAARGNIAETYALAPEVVLSTLIRCAENPLSWVPESLVCISEQCVTSAELVEYTDNTISDL